MSSSREMLLLLNYKNMDRRSGYEGAKGADHGNMSSGYEAGF